MTFRKSMRLSVSTTPLMLKSVVCQVIIIALILGLLLLIVSPIVNQVIELFEQLEIYEHLTELGEVIYTNPDSSQIPTKANAIIEDILALVNEAGDLFNSIIWTYVAVLLSLVGYRFLLSLVDYPVMAGLTDFMQMSTTKSFVWYFVKKFPRAATFSFCQLITTIWLDIFVVFGSVGFYILVLSPLKAVGVVLAVVMVILAYSSRLAAYSAWLPEYVVSGKTVYKSLQNSFTYSVGRFWKIWYKCVVIMTAMFVLNALVIWGLNALACPAFVVSLITAFISFYAYYCIKCVGVAEYFIANDKPFFTKKLKISDDTDSTNIEII